ncbi:ionotropic receptor 21a-like [Diprion similis]|uniref:ionotropic receptor 21a-like n=1 Tax=Diprion similis TaxID=362088 RepID=UPI001EF95031|nr:ionotropic receptor 21a-like [Diprion similis]XP_046744975.1 ionotropic receptor 21a-like [Diprion similis]
MAVIESVAKGVLLRNHCVNFIVDKYYHQILNLHWNKRFSYVSVYMIVVRENDDFFPPKRRFHEVLRASKATDCSAYIILNTNGLQVSRMLQYVEKERLINTRGDVILLHDYRLFNSSTNYIWNRIVNVIFIRLYNSAKRRSGEQAFPEWFDLNTVPLPYQSEGDLELQYIDTWYRGRFRYKNEHYPDKSRNLLNQSLRVPIFPHIPAVSEKLKISREGNLVDGSAAFGIEVELIKILAKALNFWPMVYVPSNVNNEKWGTAEGNGNFTGLFGEAVSGNTPFLLGDIHYTTNHLELFDLSVPYNTECLTFLTPESLNDNSWKILIMPFKMYMWLSVLMALFLGGLIFYQFAQSYKRTLHLYKEKITSENISTLQVVKRHKNTTGLLLSLYPYTEFQNSILYTYGMLLSVSLPRLPNAWALRVFIGWWWLYSILVAVAYRASMTAILANPMSRVTIDTLSQLASSQIAVGGWSEEMKEFFLSSLDTDSQEVGNKFEVINQDDEAIARVAAGKFAYYENKYFLRHARAKRQIVEEAQKLNATKHHETVTIDRNLHIMSECVIHMPISIGLDRNSPLKQHVDLVIRRVTETGLIQKWLSDTMEWTVNAERPQESSSSKGLINLRKLYGALLALGIGYVASFIALVGEIYYWKYIVQRHPTYDKYYLDLYYKPNK